MQKHHQIKINHLVRFDSSEFLYRHEVLFHLMLQIMFGLQKTKITYLQNTPESFLTSITPHHDAKSRQVCNTIYVQPFLVITFITVILKDPLGKAVILRESTKIYGGQSGALSPVTGIVM